MLLRTSVAGALFGAVLIACGCSNQAKPNTNVIDEFQGNWETVEPTKKEHAVTIKIVNDKMIIMDMGGAALGVSKSGGMQKAAPDGKQRGETDTFGVDNSTNPKQIDVSRADEGSADLGRTRLGIYAFEGDTLKICLANYDEPRPTDFAASATTVLWYLKKKP